MTVYIVTDLGYGDSGKGTTVDFITSQTKGKALVVRHNGGAQAGHNVVLNDGTHHEFSQFGSGTFQGADTFLSRFMLVDPIAMLFEAEELGEHIDDPFERMKVDVEAKIVTPYHGALNRLQEHWRGEARHGSCGRGIGVAMKQHIDRPDLTIYARDLLFTNDSYGTLRGKLEALRDYLSTLVPGSTGIAGMSEDIFEDDDTLDSIITDYRAWRREVTVVENGETWLNKAIDDRYQDVVFEGAQGVLLDEWRGFHPYTTWSTTTPHNARILLNESYYGPVVQLGVIRTYMTRHGAGPFVTEDAHLDYPEPHNTTGDWQGGFRQGHLDRLALEYAIEVCGGIDGLVVTHLDVGNQWKIADSYNLEFFNALEILPNPDKTNLKRQERLTDLMMEASPTYTRIMTPEQLLSTLDEIAPIMIESWGPTAKDKMWVDESHYEGVI